MQEGTILSDEEETYIIEPPPNAMALHYAGTGVPVRQTCTQQEIKLIAEESY